MSCGLRHCALRASSVPAAHQRRRGAPRLLQAALGDHPDRPTVSPILGDLELARISRSFASFAPNLGLRKFNGPCQDSAEPFSLPLNCLRHLKARNFFPDLAKFTVKSTAKQCCLVAIEGDRSRKRLLILATTRRESRTMCEATYAGFIAQLPLRCPRPANDHELPAQTRAHGVRRHANTGCRHGSGVRCHSA